ncbi:uncharacterized protein LOC143018359 [Oratosquilla oratoria]|uniref:uncharacterized protein LOC143018359 n=1 Tax=Oratosquilla oratoria TaxID=337810 RepID=UPI003F777451
MESKEYRGGGGGMYLPGGEKRRVSLILPTITTTSPPSTPPSTMEKVEKKLTRFRATLKNKRKLSLPVFINQFQQQWASEHGGGGGGGGGDKGGDKGGAGAGGSAHHGSTLSCSSSFGSLSSIPPTGEEVRRGSTPGISGYHAVPNINSISPSGVIHPFLVSSASSPQFSSRSPPPPTRRRRTIHHDGSGSRTESRSQSQARGHNDKIYSVTSLVPVYYRNPVSSIRLHPGPSEGYRKYCKPPGTRNFRSIISGCLFGFRARCVTDSC